MRIGCAPGIDASRLTHYVLRITSYAPRLLAHIMLSRV